MRSIGRIGVLCITLALALSVGASSSAVAKKRHLSSQVSIQAVGPDGVTGRVAGPEKPCRAQRHVDVYRVNSGQSVPSGEFVASTWTHGDGSWEIPGPVYPSQFYAVVGAKSAKRVVCSSATSNAPVWG